MDIHPIHAPSSAEAAEAAAVIACSAVVDKSNGWEGVAAKFIEQSHGSDVGVSVIREWARVLPKGAAVLDLGCGPGSPRSAVLHDEGFDVYAVDASPTLVAEYARRFPTAHVANEAAEESTFFDRKFAGVLAWGLFFLLPADAQRGLIHKVSRCLTPGGRFLFTAPAQECTWEDLSTRRTSLSLGAQEYAAALASAALKLVANHLDEGDNHYYDVGKL